MVKTDDWDLRAPCGGHGIGAVGRPAGAEVLEKSLVWGVRRHDLRASRIAHGSVEIIWFQRVRPVAVSRGGVPVFAQCAGEGREAEQYHDDHGGTKRQAAVQSRVPQKRGDPIAGDRDATDQLLVLAVVRCLTLLDDEGDDGAWDERERNHNEEDGDDVGELVQHRANAVRDWQRDRGDANGDRRLATTMVLCQLLREAIRECIQEDRHGVRRRRVDQHTHVRRSVPCHHRAENHGVGRYGLRLARHYQQILQHRQRGLCELGNLRVQVAQLDCEGGVVGDKLVRHERRNASSVTSSYLLLRREFSQDYTAVDHDVETALDAVLAEQQLQFVLLPSWLDIKGHDKSLGGVAQADAMHHAGQRRVRSRRVFKKQVACRILVMLRCSDAEPWRAPIGGERRVIDLGCDQPPDVDSIFERTRQIQPFTRLSAGEVPKRDRRDVGDRTNDSLQQHGVQHGSVSVGEVGERSAALWPVIIVGADIELRGTASCVVDAVQLVFGWPACEL